MTFGYNADVAFGNTTASIKDHAMDLLGCLVDEREDDAVSCRRLPSCIREVAPTVFNQSLHKVRYFFSTRLNGSMKPLMIEGWQ